MTPLEAAEQQQRTHKAAHRLSLILAKHGPALVQGELVFPILQPCGGEFMAVLAVRAHVFSAPDEAMEQLLDTVEDFCLRNSLDLPPEDV